jgi:hypothetical protein
MDLFGIEGFFYLSAESTNANQYTVKRKGVLVGSVIEIYLREGNPSRASLRKRAHTEDGGKLMAGAEPVDVMYDDFTLFKDGIEVWSNEDRR